uniref:Uncharacterized protein n=1 Tax=Panagrolaimus superbus TaxID=310955 RepID=A0A914YEI9_9BILA
MTDKSCPEVIYSKSENNTEDEIMRHQTSCYKRHYLNEECEISEWKNVCKLFTFTFQRSDNKKKEMMQKYCKH